MTGKTLSEETKQKIRNKLKNRKITWNTRPKGKVKNIDRKVYRKINKDKIRDYRRIYDTNHRQTIREYMKNYREANRQRINELQRIYGKSDRGRAIEIKKSVKRKTQLLDGEIILTSEIVFRDMGICQICKQPVDLESFWLDKLAPSLDHIIPLSKGGTHIHENVQLAHRICNIRKGNKFYEKKEEILCQMN